MAQARDAAELCLRETTGQITGKVDDQMTSSCSSASVQPLTPNNNNYNNGNGFTAASSAVKPRNIDVAFNEQQQQQHPKQMMPAMSVIGGGVSSRDHTISNDAFFVHHHNERDWVFGVMERLETAYVGLRCLSIEQEDLVLGPGHRDRNDATLYNKIYEGVRRSRRTVIVLTPEFLSDVWMNVSNMKLLTSESTQRNLAVLMLAICDIPNALFDVTYIDARGDEWWQKLISYLLRSDDTPQTDLTTLSSCCSPTDNNVISLHNGRLLTSLRSRCQCCCKEVVDATELPNEFLVCGVQMPAEEYSDAINQLMSDSRFVCHVWCYNVPGAVLVFTVLLCLCLSIIPLAEVRWLYRRGSSQSSGLEFVHAVVVWLCVLAIYMIAIHISKKKMKDSSYKKLTQVNRCLIKYNLLAGIENLSLADCNKYYLHFFYYDVGPCLGYLQETMINNDEYRSSRVIGHSLSGQSGRSTDDQLDSFAVEMETCDDQLSIKNDRLRVLENTIMTNASLQTKTEDLILAHSGQYISLLISKKLERPRKSRHIVDRPCLCQYIEQHVRRLVV